MVAFSDIKVPRERLLVVVLHGYGSSPKKMTAVVNAITGAFCSKCVEIYCPQLQISPLSTVSPNVIACKQIRCIDFLWNKAAEEGRPFDRVIFIGHSTGSLIARKIYVIACGITETAPFEKEVDVNIISPWAMHVDRIILLAGMNRGWRITHHLSVWRALLWWFGSLIGRALEIIAGQSLLILQVRRGATFITQLRIQWLRMRQRAACQDGIAGSCPTVQLLGSIDDYVSPADNVDLVAGGDFLYLDVPFSGHSNIIEMDDQSLPLGGVVTVGELRRSVFTEALTVPIGDLKKGAFLPDDSDDIPTQNLDVNDVIFVIHGIRDEGYWTHKVARAIRKRMPYNAKTIATETSSYGYFPMLPFLFVGYRRQKVEWLMDRYATAIAIYPNASRFHFVGHSNGTYCLMEALRLYSCCRFDNVVLAGSVVRTKIAWQDYLRSDVGSAQNRLSSTGTVAKVLNIVATSDWVVAVLPKLFQTALPIQRLGSAGHDGFSDPPKKVEQICFVKGAHSAGVSEPIWPVIAEFIATGKISHISDKLIESRRNRIVVFFGFFPWLWWIFAVVILGLVGYFIFPSADNCYEEIVIRLFIMLIYIGLILRIVTWF